MVITKWFDEVLRPWQTRTHCCGHIVAHDVSWAAQTGKHLLRTQNVSEQNQKHFLCPGHKFVPAHGQTGKHLCRQQCIRNNVSSFARALSRASDKNNISVASISSRLMPSPINLIMLANVEKRFVNLSKSFFLKMKFRTEIYRKTFIFFQAVTVTNSAIWLVLSAVRIFLSLTTVTVTLAWVCLE